MTSIWVPESHKWRGLAAARQAVKEYDTDLDFGFNEQTQQWCVFLKHGTTQLTQEGDLPILGFRDIPHPDDVKKRLYQSDARRRGLEIVDAIQRHNDDMHKELEHKAEEASNETAEAFEWGMRKMGHPGASVKVFIPGE